MLLILHADRQIIKIDCTDADALFSLQGEGAGQGCGSEIWHTAADTPIRRRCSQEAACNSAALEILLRHYGRVHGHHHWSLLSLHQRHCFPHLERSARAVAHSALPACAHLTTACETGEPGWLCTFHSALLF